MEFICGFSIFVCMIAVVVLSISDNSPLNELGGISTHDSPRFHIFICASPGTNHSTLTDGYARSDECFGGNPGPVADGYGLSCLMMVWIGYIMTGRAEERPLAHRRIHSYMDWGGIIAVHSVSYTCVVIHHKVPGHVDFS